MLDAGRVIQPVPGVWIVPTPQAFGRATALLNGAYGMNIPPGICSEPASVAGSDMLFMTGVTMFQYVNGF
jgi:hypothetical protein